MHDGFFPLPASAERTTCRSCGAPIAWVIGARGGHMPLDLGTVEQRDGVMMAQTHFATCPQAPTWSKKKRYPANDDDTPVTEQRGMEL